MIGIYPEVYIESFRALLTRHQINEEGSLIRLGQCLPTGIQSDKGVSHIPSRSGSSSIRKTLLLHVRAIDHSLRALLAQNNDQNHEQTIHYLSRTMIGADHCYNPIKKECLVLVFVIQKM